MIRDFVSIDLETTGLLYKEDGIIELAAVRFRDGKEEASFHTYINPGREIPERITELTGISKEQVKTTLRSCGISEEKVAKFSVDYDEAFGFEAELHPKNIINNKKFEINTPDVSIKVNPARSDLIETRIIGGVKYILICADENVEVNGVNIHIEE